MKDARRYIDACRGALLLSLLAGSLAACATRPPDSDPEALAAFEQANDPLEPFNRAMWSVNTVLDEFLLRPATWLYRKIVPKPLRGAMSRMVENANYPVVIANSLLQGEFTRAWTATKRLLVNTTVGLGGMADPASAWGIEKIDEDFGQTLAVWGIGDGPYLVLPVIGPTNPRDAVGFVGDALSEPVGLALDVADHRTARYAWTGISVVINRDDHWGAIDEVYRAEDPYAFARSAFRQHRRYQISNGAVSESKEEQDLFDQDFDEEEEPPAAAAPPQASAALPHAPVRRDPIERVLLGPGFTLHGGR